MTKVRKIRLDACMKLAVVLVTIAGCSSSSGTGGAAAGNPADGGGAGTEGGTTGDAGIACVTYTPTAIAAMRNPGASGCFELDNVVLVARTASTTTPRLYVQDPKGGDYSAIMAKCSTTSTHACAATALATALQLLNGESVTIRGYYEHGKVTGFEELAIESITDNGSTLAIPPPITLNETDIGRDARVPAKWFQKATVNVTKLVMYDLSPAEMKLAGPCPAWEGFGLIPASAGAPAAGACAGTTNPNGIAAPASGETLIGRQFFHNFTYSTDCGCAAAHNQVLLTPASFVAGAMSGFLVLETLRGSTTGFQVFEPTSKGEFPVQ